jgi:flagellar hook-length control protein FliK
MQVNLAPPAGTDRPACNGRAILRPDSGQLLEPSPAARSRHELDQEWHAEQRRRKDVEQHEIAASAANSPRPSELMLRAEREMAPGSHAARDQQLRGQLQDQVSQKPVGFRQALTDAARQGSGDRSSTPARTPVADAPSGPSAPSTAGGAEDAKPARPPATTPTATPQTATRGGAMSGSPSPAGGASTGSASSVSAAPRAPVGNVVGAVQAGVRIAVSARASATSPSGSATIAGAGRASPATAAPHDMQRLGATGPKVAGRPSAPPEPEPRSSDANIERIVRYLHTRIGKERSVATLRLDPPELGTIRLRMDLRNDQLSLEVETHTAAAQQLLADQAETLRRSLEVSGIHLERLEIRAPAVTPDASDAHHPPQAGVWTGADQNRAHSDAESAGGGSSGEAESPAAEPPELVGGAVPSEPVAESLVNIWA